MGLIHVGGVVSWAGSYFVVAYFIFQGLWYSSFVSYLLDSRSLITLFAMSQRAQKHLVYVSVIRCNINDLEAKYENRPGQGQKSNFFVLRHVPNIVCSFKRTFRLGYFKIMINQWR